MNGFVADYVYRHRVTTNLTFFIVYNLSVPRLVEGDRYFCEIVDRAAKLICTTPEFDDLAAEVGLRPSSPQPPSPRAGEGGADLAPLSLATVYTQVIETIQVPTAPKKPTLGEPNRPPTPNSTALRNSLPDGRAQRRQITLASPPKSRFRPLQRSVSWLTPPITFKYD